MYGVETSRFYELQHRARGKDYNGEARTVVHEVKSRNSEAASLLDVACGTGGHFDVFVKEFSSVEGVDISRPMVELCRRAHPDVPADVADMRELDLGRRFDAITCLFASIAYVDDVEQLGRTVQAFADHLNPGGALAVEPWWTPDRFIDGWTSTDVVEADGVTLLRASLTVRDGSASVMEVHYLAVDEAISHVTEVHRAQLFDREQYEEAFISAGLTVDYVPDVLSGRGLFVGTRP